ncbi:acetolactate synthase 3 large subunit [Amphiplicatus metriothermophilus]|uniref:Acetolactate synthase n=1 Tax=Amphiplicatus metriothermophilus TaxID=1519374 RepID=A0A239Q001_9PROT|nr:acetolactate synthase 3 large subunit [Amphiplicatus metriothermophilus]MBB5519758.1 acetolactate synthase-1/2/3 large subunit [Amphiplicatus metriothermophilus]SNT75247.1 acetolactate synthase, large subunit [Amphiplicatus metriothermophilus]
MTAPTARPKAAAPETAAAAATKAGAELLLDALEEQGVEVIFGYPGGAVLPIYDALYARDTIRHVLVRHEQGAVHAAEGYARSTGKPGVVLVTSGPGATNAVTGLADALLDSIPVVCITGQVARKLIGTDAFQECDTIGITRACTKHNYLVPSAERLSSIVHEAFHVATNGRPGPVLIDIPKDVQFEEAVYVARERAAKRDCVARPPVDRAKIAQAVEMMRRARRPVLYTGGGVVNAGRIACDALRVLARDTGFPVTSTLMGLGAFPASDPKWLGMLGMHGSVEANNAMHDCDLMIAVGARFDDRVTGRLDAFSPDSRKIHIDIDPSSINKNVPVDLAIVGDAGEVMAALLAEWRARAKEDPLDDGRLALWRAQIDEWRAKRCFAYEPSRKVIKPQHAIERLYALTRGRDVYVTTEVGQHQMWAAQFFHFDEPNRWMTSGGLGTMGYGLPAAIGVQAAHPGALVIDIAGDASVQMTLQEMATAVQHRLPIKVFILNNEYLGMVRQWQELLHGGRYSHSYSASLPDFVKLAEAYGAVGLRATTPDELDAKIMEMIACDRPVLFDCVVSKEENVFPMIPSGAAHNEMLLGAVAGDKVSAEGRTLV